MSEYTPDTERIRLVFRMGGSDADARLTREDVFDRWLAAHDAEVRAGVVVEEPEGRRWFSAAYRAQNGNIIPIGDETVLAEYAQKTVDEFSREDDEGPNYFLASRILSPWVPVKQEGAETDA